MMITTRSQTPRTCFPKHRIATAATFCMIALASLGLSACGGGGGSDNTQVVPVPTPVPEPTKLIAPPTTAGSLAQSGEVAQDSVKAATAAAADLVRRSEDPSSMFLPFGELMGGRQNSPKPSAAEPERRKILETTTVSCSSLGISIIRNCSGSIVVDTNVSNSATSLPAGSYISMRFDKISGIVDGQSLSIDGSMRIDFLTAVSNLDTPGNNVRLQLSFDKLSASGGGESFGPLTAVALLEVDGQGKPSLTLNGVQYGGLNELSVTDANNYSLGHSRLRSAHWSDSKVYVDTQFSNWQTSNGRPLQGSSATLTAGKDSALITVESSSNSQVSYRVQLSSGGVAKNYQVLASYNGSTVSYSVKAL